MKLLFFIILLSLFLVSCSSESQERKYEIVFENKINSDGYYNGPLVYTQEREEFERKERNWDKKIDKFYSKNE